MDGVVTASIPHNAVATRIASALTALPNVAGPVEVVKEQEASAATTGGASTISAWRVAFVSNVGDLSLMTVQVGKKKGQQLYRWAKELVRRPCSNRILLLSTHRSGRLYDLMCSCVPLQNLEYRVKSCTNQDIVLCCERPRDRFSFILVLFRHIENVGPER